MVHAILLALVVLLAGCGGGSKGAASAPVDNSVREQVRARVASANSFMVADTVVSVRSGQAMRYAGSCRGTTCQWSGIAGPLGKDEALERFSNSQYTSEGVYRGVNMARRVNTGLSNHSYGGWLNYHAFEVEERTLSGGEYTGTVLDGSKLLAASIAGHAWERNPVDKATWTGAMVGKDTHGLNRHNYQGDVIMGYNGGMIDVNITNIRNRSTNSVDSRTLGWSNLVPSAGRFGVRSSSTNYLRGEFYGPNQEEAGAVFEQQGITGAFGAKR